MQDNLPSKIWIPIIILAAFGVCFLVLAKLNSFWPYQGQNDNSFVLIPIKHSDNTQALGWKTYLNEELGYEMKYPSEWFMQSEAETVTFSNVDQRSPLSEEAMQNESIFIVEVLKGVNSRRLAIDEWFDDHFSQGFANEPISITLVTVGGRSAIRLEISEIGRRLHYYVPDGADVVEISYGLYSSKFIEIYTQILSTFKFIEPTSQNDGEVACIQVITPARNKQTGEVRDFPTPCDVPQGWEIIR